MGMFDDLIPAKKEMSWADVPGQALRNAPRSAYELGESIVQPILHPIETGKALYKVGEGLASKAAGALGVEQDPTEKAQAEAAADAIGKFFVERYGSMDALKRTLATDPVGAAADAATVLTGGGAAAARAPGVAGKVGQVVAKAGEFIDPISNAAKAVAPIARGAGEAGAAVLGLTTGAGNTPIKEGFKAGREGNPAFVENMRGQRSLDDVIDMADSAVKGMGRDRSAAYQAGIQSTKADKTVLDIKPIFQSLRQAYADVTYKGVAKDAEAVGVLKEMSELVNQYRNIPNNEGRVAEALDALKQGLGEIMQRTREGSMGRRIAEQVYKDTRAQIVKQVPEYAKTMADYTAASDRLSDVKRTFSMSEKAAPDTTMRKLQSTMRNNVNTNYGQRQKLLDELAKYEPDLPASLAGQSMNSIMPRGLSGSATGLGGVYASFSTPAAAAMVPLSSPRVVGEVVQGAGRAMAAVDSVVQAMGVSQQQAINILRSAYATGELTDPELKRELMQLSRQAKR